MTEGKSNYRYENKARFNPMRGNEVDYDDAEAEIDFTNMSKELQEYVIKNSREAISKS